MVNYRERIVASRLMFIDETWTKPIWRRCGVGHRAVKGSKPRCRMAAFRYDRITAPWFIDSPINGDAFQLYVEKSLVPTLQPDDIVMMDNLGSREGQGRARRHSSCGARLFFLRKYSPEPDRAVLPSSNIGVAKRQSEPSRPSTMQSLRSLTDTASSVHSTHLLQ